MNLLYVVLICVSALSVLSLAGGSKKPILKLKNVNYNKTVAKSPKKSQKVKTIFLLSNPVIYPQKSDLPKPTKSSIQSSPPPPPTNAFDFLNFDAYILKPRNINYTALLFNRQDNAQTQELKSPATTQPTNYQQHELLDFARAEPLIQTTIPPPIETTTPQTKRITEKQIETTTGTVSSIFPLGLAYFDSLRKYRKAFELRKSERTKKPRIKTTTTSTTTTTFAPTTEVTETEEPFTETVPTTEYHYDDDRNNDEYPREYQYDEPHFESYRYTPRHHQNYDDHSDRDRFETTTYRYPELEPFDHEDNRYESDPTETVTTTTKPPNSRPRRRPRNKNTHSSHVKSNFLYDRHINYPQAEESRQVLTMVKPDNYNGRRRVQDKSNKFVNERRDVTPKESREQATTDNKKHKNIVPMQRHYFQ